MAWGERRKAWARLARLVATLSGLLAAAQVQAETPLSAREFRDSCTRATDDWVSFCNGYAQAAADVATLSELACLPEGATRGDIVAEIDRLAFDRIASGEIPGETPAFAVAISALQTLYPCDPDGEASE